MIIFLKNITIWIVTLLVDLLIMFLCPYIYFDLFKNELDNFYANYYSFIEFFSYMFTMYMLLFSAAFYFQIKYKSSFLHIIYGTFIIIVISLLSTIIFNSFKDSNYPFTIALSGSVVQLIIITLWHSGTNNLYRRLINSKE